jgi:transposase, IS5 family
VAVKVAATHVDRCSIRQYAVTRANIHDSQMLPRLLNPENGHDYFWADSGYSGECFADLLRLGGFERPIQEKAPRKNPLSEVAKELNRVKSSIRACLGCMTMPIVGKMTKIIGLARTEGWFGLKNSHSTCSDICSALPACL